eukprot:980391-Rhodomonas_salina.2
MIVTEKAYGASSYAISGTETAVWRYAMSGTELGYGAIRYGDIGSAPLLARYGPTLSQYQPYSTSHSS